MSAATEGARRTLRQALTVARRDFTATVFTPIFLLFLFAPVLMGVFGGLVGGVGAAGAIRGDGRARIVAIVPADQAHAVAAADTRLRAVFRSEEDEPPPLLTVRPAGAPVRQARAAFSSADYEATAVLFGPLAHPHVLYGPSGSWAADYLSMLAGATLAAERLGSTPAVRIPLGAAAPSHGQPHASAFFAVFGVFILTLFLSSPVIGSMTEERNNKVIEILAAAVPLEAVFFGKLIGMFGIALMFVAFWGTMLLGVGALLPPPLAQALATLRPATGAAFPFLFFAYFTMAYMLLGAVYLGIGAQATSTREVQLLSLPITILQMGMFGIATAAASHQGSGLALAAELFPLSSAYAMAGHAAARTSLWPHLAALAWQALWVSIFVAVGARAFRRGVLQSGSPRPRWLGRGRAAMADNIG